MLRIHDPIRNYKSRTTSFIDIFEKDFVPNHRFTLESIVYQDSVPFYKIKLKTLRYIGGERETALAYWVEGYVYIQVRTLAIEKLLYSLYYTYNNNSHLLVDMKLEYKEYRGKMYLNYFSFMNVFKTTIYGNVHEFNQYRELFINQVRLNPLVTIPANDIISNDSSLLKNRVPDLKGFWDTYNVAGSNMLLGKSVK